ncbi:MAG: response regulator [Candidatus Ornithospirochaeta sp.]
MEKRIQKDEELAVRQFLHAFLDKTKDKGTIMDILSHVGEHYDADRSYIFEYDAEKSVFNNTYEWCRDGVNPEIDNLQGIPKDGMECWFEAFDEEGEFFISSLSEDFHPGTRTYEILAPQGIESLMAAPIVVDGETVGFLGVDNPHSRQDSLLLLSVAASTLYSEVAKERMVHQKLKETEKILSDRERIIQSMSEIYTSTYYIDLSTSSFVELSAREKVKREIGSTGNAAERLEYFCRNLVDPSQRDEMLVFTDLSTLDLRLRDKKIITKEFLSLIDASPETGNKPIWAECSFIVSDRSTEGRLEHVVFTTRIIHDAKVKELDAMEATRDEMEIAAVLSREYPDVVLLDLDDDTAVTIKRQGSVIRKDQRTVRRSYKDTWDIYIGKYVRKEDREAVYAAIDKEKVKSSLAESDEYSFSYGVVVGEESHHYQASYIRFRSRHNAESQIILGFRCIDTIVEEERKNQEIHEEQLRIIGALSQEYSSLFKIDSKTRKMTLYRTDSVSFNPVMLEKLLALGDYELILSRYIDVFVMDEDKDRLKSSITLDVLKEKVPDVGLFKLGYRRIMGGVVSYFEMNTAKIVDDRGNITFILGLRDVDEEARRQLKATREMEEQREIIEGLGSEYYSVLLVDPDSDTVRIFRAEEDDGKAIAEYVTKMGNSWSRLIDEYSKELVSSSSRTEFCRKLSLSHIREDGDDYSVTYEKIKDGSIIYLQARVAFVHDKNGGLMAVVGTRNVDDLIKKERQQEMALQAAFDAAEAASRAKTDFLSNMSHDIRTPMNGIIGMTAIAAAHIDDKERVMDCLKKTTQASKHLLSLINEVLDMSKIESGKVELSEEEFNLSDLIENLISMTSGEIEKRGHDFSVNIGGVVHERVIGDSLRIQKIFTNLMSNAVKYTPDGGRIKLSISEKPCSQAHVGCYEVIFEDNGIGMSEEFLGHIFEPFSRDSGVGNAQGTGLGMAISRNIARMMGGDIKVESKLGVGSRFTVTMYLRLQEDEKVDYDKFLDLDVLVADDDEMSLDSCCTMLSDMGMKAEGVTSGRGALEKVVSRHEEERDYFALILDWKMPDMDGIATTREIRRKVGNDVPIIIISAYDWSDIEEEARGAGANAFISKPLFRSRLVKTFSSLVDSEEKEKEETPLKNFEDVDFSGHRVLLVEDNALNSEIAVELLEMTGLEVDSVEDGASAVDIITECPDGYYDLVFMDIQMPRMNGYDATRAIRASNRRYTRQVPIVAMTANAFAEDVAAARTAGMNDHIPKPLDTGLLIATLEKYLHSEKE